MRSAGCASLAVLASCLAAGQPARAAPPPVAPLDVLLIVDVSASVDGLAPGSVGGFLGALPVGTRLAVIAFADTATIVRPLATLSGPTDLDAAAQTIFGLAFGGKHTELGDGLLLALLEGAADEHPPATRRVVLLSDGRSDPAAGRAANPAALRSLRDEILPAYAAAGLPVFTVARGDPDLALLREIAERTGGRCALAPDDRSLEDALALLAAGFAVDAAPPVEPAAAPVTTPTEVQARRAPKPAVRPSADLPESTPALAAALAASLLALLVAVRRRRAAAARTDTPAAEAAAATQRAQRLDLEDQLVVAWEAERAARDAQHQLADELFLVLDHLDRAAAAAPGDGGLVRFRDKLGRALDGAGIDEIRVEVGDGFDSGAHRHVGERDADLPRGAVLAVTRKGYVHRGPGGAGGARVLRPAEVVLSSGR